MSLDVQISDVNCCLLLELSCYCYFCLYVSTIFQLNLEFGIVHCLDSKPVGGRMYNLHFRSVRVHPDLVGFMLLDL